MAKRSILNNPGKKALMDRSNNRSNLGMLFIMLQQYWLIISANSFPLLDDGWRLQHQDNSNSISHRKDCWINFWITSDNCFLARVVPDDKPPLLRTLIRLKWYYLTEVWNKCVRPVLFFISPHCSLCPQAFLVYTNQAHLSPKTALTILALWKMCVLWVMLWLFVEYAAQNLFHMNGNGWDDFCAP